MNDLDRSVELWINGWPEGLSPFLTFFSTGINWLPIKILLGLVVIGMLWRGARSRKAVLLALAAVGLANPLTDLLKHFFPFHRPFQPQALGSLIHLRVGDAPSMGTASAHTANMTAVATVMFLTMGRWGWPWAAVALLTGLSRMYSGAHFPSQTLLGALCGLGVGFLVVYGYGWIERAIKTKAPKFSGPKPRSPRINDDGIDDDGEGTVDAEPQKS